MGARGANAGTRARAAACGGAAAGEVTRLVAVVDAGVARPRPLAIPASAAGSRFPHLCLRKLYVLCSRGAEAGAPQGCLLQARAMPIRVSVGHQSLPCSTLCLHFDLVVVHPGDWRAESAAWSMHPVHAQPA